MPLSIDDVRAAAARIAPFVHRTPVCHSSTLDRELGASVFFKCENLQKIGAFKARGATNAVLKLDDQTAAAGVVTHSSGNHAQALAYAAGIRGVPCTVVMPDSAPAVKVAAVRDYGAEIVFCRQADREQTCARVIAEQRATLIHPFENPDVVAGQATVVLELLEQVPDLDSVIVPVGGGGLFAGTAVTVSALRPEIELFGAEPIAVDDAYRSLQTGVRQPAVPDPDTIADGWLTGLGELAFAVVSTTGARIVTVSESAIVAAAQFLLLRMKLLVEPSAATVLAGLREHCEHFRGRRIGAVLSGGNTTLDWYCHRDSAAQAE